MNLTHPPPSLPTCFDKPHPINVSLSTKDSAAFSLSILLLHPTHVSANPVPYSICRKILDCANIRLRNAPRKGWFDLDWISYFSKQIGSWLHRSRCAGGLAAPREFIYLLKDWDVHTQSYHENRRKSINWWQGEIHCDHTLIFVPMNPAKPPVWMLTSWKNCLTYERIHVNVRKLLDVFFS